MFNKILIANRGEIAVRVIRTCRELGVQSVAVYAKSDAESMHVHLADEAYCVGASTIQESYLKDDAILQVALSTGCDAIHPGYGLLSENAGFAKRVEDEGLVFIGPSSELIAMLGDKEQARQAMQECGVPVIPGGEDIASVDDALALGDAMGYPVLLKAALGGGGKGIRRIDKLEEMATAWDQASFESATFFKEGRLYLEKYLDPVKHVEVQILADQYGHVKVLGERDCSVQRRNQKLIEESPCATLSEDTRQRMFSVSQRAMEKLGYVGAATIEYLLDANGDFYFMEVNTRLQVEHPVTEFTTGIDIVKWQIRIACGVSIQDMVVHSRGHAIECRILAEDAQKGFAPQTGRIDLLVTPGGPFVRFDTAAYSGLTFLPFYDSLIGKLIVWDETRDGAIRKMKSSLGELIVEGIQTTADECIRIIDAPHFAQGTSTTKEID